MNGMNNEPEISDVDRAMLTGLVRQALGSLTAEVREWEHEPVRYINTEQSNLGVHRFKGTAEQEAASANGLSCSRLYAHRAMTTIQPSGTITGVRSLLTNRGYSITFREASQRRAVLTSPSILTACVGCGWKTSRVHRAEPGRWQSMLWLRGTWGDSMEHMPRGIRYPMRPGSVDIGCEAGLQSMSRVAARH